MEYKDFVLKNSDFKTSSSKSEKEKKQKKNVEYKIEYENGLDIAILRKTQKTEKLLVCLPSQDLFYIKSKDLIVDISKDTRIAEQEIKAFFKELEYVIEGKNVKVEKNNLQNIPFLFAYSKTEKFNNPFENIEIIKEIIKILFSIGIELKGRIIPRRILSNLCLSLDLSEDTGKTKEETFKSIITYMKEVIMYFYEKGKIQDFIDTLFTYENCFYSRNIFLIDYDNSLSNAIWTLGLGVWEYQAIFNRLTIAYMVRGEHEKAFQFFKKLMESDYNKTILKQKDGTKIKKFDIISNGIMYDSIVKNTWYKKIDTWYKKIDESLIDLIQSLDKFPKSKENEFWEYLANYPKFCFQSGMLGTLNYFLDSYVTSCEIEEKIFEGEIPILFMNKEVMYILEHIYIKERDCLFEMNNENKQNLQNWLLEISKK